MKNFPRISPAWNGVLTIRKRCVIWNMTCETIPSTRSIRQTRLQSDIARMRHLSAVLHPAWVQECHPFRANGYPGRLRRMCPYHLCQEIPACHVPILAAHPPLLAQRWRAVKCMVTSLHRRPREVSTMTASTMLTPPSPPLAKPRHPTMTTPRIKRNLPRPCCLRS